MSEKHTVRVAVPVKLARLRIWVDKGRPWSAVDRLVLWALAHNPCTASDLAKAGGVPARMITEIVLRMMRFGWVELAATSRGASFRATETGREVVETFETLPPVTCRVARRISFTMEPFILCSYGLRDLKPYRPTEIDAIEREHDVRRITIEGGWTRVSSLDLYAAADRVLSHDEELSSIDYSGSDTFDQFALFPVIGSSIKGLPADPPEELVVAIRKAAADPRRGAAMKVSTHRREAASHQSFLSLPEFRPDDIILSGADHRERLVEILRQARSRFVMHSTFLREAAFVELQDEFRRAAKRGVLIDIFWGANRDERDKTNNLDAAIAINHRIASDSDLRSRARVHLYTTRSHAKLLVADASGRARDEYVAVVGSCNWLYSGFNRVEVSVVLRSPHAVARVAEELSELVFDIGTSSTVVGDLTSLVRTLRSHPGQDGPTKLRLVRGDEHSELMRLARNTAKKSIMIGGDRLGLAAEARTIIPMMATQNQAVQRAIYYSKHSGPVSQRDAQDLATQARSAGVRLIQVEDRELHGKFLLWDDNHLIATSLNWSSADTRHDSPQSEIGLYIVSPGIAADVRRRLDVGLRVIDAATDDTNGVARPRSRRRRKRRPPSGRG